MIEGQIHSDPEQPGSEPAGWIKLIEPDVRPEKGLLRKIFCQFDIRHKTKDNADQPTLVPLNQSAEGISVSATRVLHQSGIADSSRVLLGTAREEFRVRHELPVGPARLDGSHS